MKCSYVITGTFTSIAACVLCLCLTTPVLAKTRSIYAPIADLDAKHGMLFVFSDGKMVIVQASEKAKPHIGKLPISGLIDIVVEDEAGRKYPVLKSWKLYSGESECKVFDGTSCK